MNKDKNLKTCKSCKFWRKGGGTYLSTGTCLSGEMESNFIGTSKKIETFSDFGCIFHEDEPDPFDEWFAWSGLITSTAVGQLNMRKAWNAALKWKEENE